MSCAFTSKILWARTVAVHAESNVAHNKADPILKDKGTQLSWKKNSSAFGCVNIGVWVCISKHLKQ